MLRPIRPEDIQTLIVKAANHEDAMRVTKRRGFEVVHVVATPDKDTTDQYVVRVRRDLELASRWLAELARPTLGQGYPPGTLLWYSPPTQLEEEGRQVFPTSSTNECPLNLADILCADFRAMSSNDYDMFAGLEGHGWIAEVKSCLVVYDEGAEGGRGAIQVHHNDGRSWGFNVDHMGTLLT